LIITKVEVVKRDNRTKIFQRERIEKAVESAREDAGIIDETLGIDIANLVEQYLEDNNIDCISVEDIQDLVVEFLKQENVEVAKAYQEYRQEREVQRIKNSQKERFYNEVLQCTNIDNDNANVNQWSFSGRKYRIADYEQKEYALRNLISKEGKEAFEQGEIYYHDLASYAIGDHNCTNLNIDNGLNHGFSTRNGDVRPSNSYSTACQLIAVMFQCQSQIQYGGVGANHIDFSLRKSVKQSFRKHFKDGFNWLEAKYNISNKEIEEILGKELMSIEDSRYKQISEVAYKYAMAMLEKEGKQATEGLYHNLNTLESRAGSQLPFTSVNTGRDTTPEGRLINKWIFNASLNGIGKLNRTSIFPISIFQYKKGVNAHKGDPNYDLKKLAIESLSKRIYPNFANGDYKPNVEDPNNPDTFFATMG
jgi:ribonucleoside-triphosphate reductase